MTEPNDRPPAPPAAATPADLAHAGRRTPQPLDPRTEERFHAQTENPLLRFAGLLELARENPHHREPTAMALSTVDADGQPSSRIVLLKSQDARGFVFYTNLGSRKGRAIAQNPRVALLFHWQPLEVQVRIEGRAVQVPDAEADAYFATRPRRSQLGAWASDQSAPLASREELVAKFAAIEAKFAGQPVTRPPGWSGFRVEPLAMEFWRNQESRLHERELYMRGAVQEAWSRTLLNP
jgi:pyridoxamine 5'-phosphate oxidase